MDYFHTMVTSLENVLHCVLHVSVPGAVARSEARWHASGLEFDPNVQHILSWRLGHENISTAILPR